MQCPECGGKGRVTSTFNYGQTLLRYRRCRICNHAWKAWESSDDAKVKKYKPRQTDTADMFTDNEGCKAT